MPKIREKISQCPSSLEELMSRANSLPENFPFEPGIDFPLRFELPIGIENQKKAFYKLVATLPKDYIDKQKMLKAFFDGKTVTEPNVKPGWLPKEQPWEEQWIERLLIPEKPLDYLSINPLLELKKTIREARSIRRTLNKAIDICIKSLMPTPYALRRMQTNELFPYIYNPQDPSAREKIVFKIEDHIENLKLENEEIPFLGYEVVKGVIEPRHSYVFNILINERIDTRRIKKCANCKNFFWAKRLNKEVENEGCESCANTLRQRRFQRKNKEEINAQRSKKRFDKQVIEVRKVFKNAKTDFEKMEAEKKLRSVTSKRTKAAQLLFGIRSKK